MGADALPRSSDGLLGCRCIQSNACLTAAVVTAAANLQENASTQRSNGFMQFRLAVRHAKRSNGKALVGEPRFLEGFVLDDADGFDTGTQRCNLGNCRDRKSTRLNSSHLVISYAV